jgi:DNA-directed RNA polymerase subunit delta
MPMVDIAFEILKATNHPQNFHDLMKQIAALRNMTEAEMMKMIAQVYTEVNIDGRFVCLGDNVWGLKRWYPMEAVEEAQESGKKKKVLVDDDFDYEEETDELDEEYEEEDDLELLDVDEFDEDVAALDDEPLDDDELLDDEDDLFDDEELVEEEPEGLDEENDDF